MSVFQDFFRDLRTAKAVGTAEAFLGLKPRFGSLSASVDFDNIGNFLSANGVDCLSSRLKSVRDIVSKDFTLQGNTDGKGRDISPIIKDINPFIQEFLSATAADLEGKAFGWYITKANYAPREYQTGNLNEDIFICKGNFRPEIIENGQNVSAILSNQDPIAVSSFSDIRDLKPATLSSEDFYFLAQHLLISGKQSLRELYASAERDDFDACLPSIERAATVLKCSFKQAGNSQVVCSTDLNLIKSIHRVDPKRLSIELTLKPA